MTLKSLVFGLVFQVIALPTVSGDVRPLQEYWKETPFTFSNEIRNSFRISACMSSESEFIGCILGVQSLVSHIKPEPVSLVTNHMLVENDFDIEKTVETFYGFRAVYSKDWAISSEGLSPLEVFLKYKKRSKDEVKVWGLLYQHLVSKDIAIDFSKVLNWVEDRISPALKENEQTIVAAALNRYLEYVFDPHTRLVPFQYMVDQQNSSTQSFVGVGIMLKEYLGKLLITQPVEGGPAIEAGLKAGDIILSVDKNVIGKNITTAEAPSKIRGKEGTVVVLTVQRKDKILKFPITRKKVVSQNVEFKVLEHNNKRVGYIFLRSFMPNTSCQKVEEALDSFAFESLSGIVLDLRGNTGGLLEQGICITDLFIPSGKKVLISKKDSSN